VLHEVGAPVPAGDPLAQLLARGVNCPVTSSAGRLFDAVASLLGLRDRASYEGQAAMELEAAAEAAPSDEADPIPLSGEVLDWAPAILALARDPARAAARFHNTLVAGIVSVARAAGVARVLLTGGCFQNRVLTERAVHALRAAGFTPYWHRRIPPNDGGIAVGQILAASWR